MSSKIEVIKQTFLAGESMNVNNFVKFFTDDCRYKFGNFPEAHGPQGIVNTSGEFLKRVKAVKHNILEFSETEETVFVEMTVDYTMMDGTVISLPVCDSIVIENDKVKEMKIFMDASPLFADPEPSSEASPSGDAVDLAARIGAMYAALHKEDWETFKTFFTDSVLYKIGANDPVIGPNSIAGMLSEIYKTLKLTSHNQRGFWIVDGNTVILEMDANYVNKKQEKFVQVPCTDIYRFEGDKIFEWRVYPDASRTGLQLS